MTFVSLFRWARYASMLLVDTALRWTGPTKRARGGVLLVRVDAIGDFVLWLDAGRHLAESYRHRGQRVVLAANSSWAAWATELGIFDQVIAVDIRAFLDSVRYRVRIQREIQRAGSSIAINPTFSRTLLLDDSIIRVCGAPERIGSQGDSALAANWKLRLGGRWYTRLVPASLSARMELVRNADFVRNLVDPAFQAKLPAAPVSAQANASAAEFAGSGQPYYVLFPGASWQGRQWPVERFREVAERLFRHTGWHGLVCGGPADRVVAERLCRDANAPLKNIAGATGLAQLAAVLAGANLLITNETSAVHIGAACRVPTVCVVGGGHFGRFVPYQFEDGYDGVVPRVVTHPMDCFGCNWNCIYATPADQPVPCIERVAVEQVWSTICGALGWAAEAAPGPELLTTKA